MSRVPFAGRVLQAVILFLSGALFVNGALVVSSVVPVRAEQAVVAVAANFAAPMDVLKTRFEAETAHTLTVTTGSTGKLYVQIIHGAPFDLFLSADQARAARLEESRAGVSGSRFTYATGRLALWSRDRDRIGAGSPDVLKDASIRALAMANPDLAPYGLAARETLVALGLLDRLKGKIVFGENVGQAFALVATGNAELGFVALSQVRSLTEERQGSHWAVPERLHSPIRQDAVLLTRAADNPAALAFIAFLQSPEANALIGPMGYAVPASPVQ